MARQAPRSMLDIDGDPDQNHRPWEAGAIEPLKSLYSCLLVHREKDLLDAFLTDPVGMGPKQRVPKSGELPAIRSFPSFLLRYLSVP